jgi:hypothetical protein
MDKEDALHLQRLVEGGNTVLCRHMPRQFCFVIGVDTESMTAEMAPGDGEYAEAAAAAFTAPLGQAVRGHFVVTAGIAWPARP